MMFLASIPFWIIGVATVTVALADIRHSLPLSQYEIKSFVATALFGAVCLVVAWRMCL